MRRFVTTSLSIFLIAFSYGAIGDFAALVDEAVLVQKNINSSEEKPPASYLTSGGYAVTSKTYIDAAGMVFDFGATTSVASATLRLPIETQYALEGEVPIKVFAFSDNGVIGFNDYANGFPVPVAELNAAGLTEIVVDVTGMANAILRSSNYMGIRVVSSYLPKDIPANIVPAFRGVKLNATGYTLEFTPGFPAPSDEDMASFDGFELNAPTISVPGFGIVDAEFQLLDVNNGLFTLTEASVESGNSGGGLSGLDLLNCNAFEPPSGAGGVTEGVATYSITSGLLDIAQTSFNGAPHSAILEYVEGTEPMQFRMVSLKPYLAGSDLSTVSALGGGTTIEPTQDFVPLCHGWILIGDSSSNRLVERNIISGETGGIYPFNTQPDQLLLDDVNNIVYFSTHPETERLYKLHLGSGIISYNRISEGERQFVPRDMVMGENGNLFAILFDREKLPPAHPLDPSSPSGLWLGILNSNATPQVANTPLDSSKSIDYDPVFKRIFMTTASNLSTFAYNTSSKTLSFVTGTNVPIGSGCSDLDISPKGNRLAYACPQGNNDSVTPLAIHDLDPVDYYNPDGEWYLGTSPISATFNNDGDLLIATDGSKLFFFDVVTHLSLAEFELGIPADEKVKKIRISRDGNILLVFIENELNDINGRMYWMPMPDISGTPVF